jgi:hypothetical protein
MEMEMRSSVDAVDMIWRCRQILGQLYEAVTGSPSLKNECMCLCFLTIVHTHDVLHISTLVLPELIIAVRQTSVIIEDDD